MYISPLLLEMQLLVVVKVNLNQINWLLVQSMKEENKRFHTLNGELYKDLEGMHNALHLFNLYFDRESKIESSSEDEDLTPSVLLHQEEQQVITRYLSGTFIF